MNSRVSCFVNSGLIYTVRTSAVFSLYKLYLAAVMAEKLDFIYILYKGFKSKGSSHIESQ